MLHGINPYKVCPVCKKTDMLEVRNYSMIWHDGDVWCVRCDVFVRTYDAG